MILNPQSEATLWDSKQHRIESPDNLSVCKTSRNGSISLSKEDLLSISVSDSPCTNYCVSITTFNVLAPIYKRIGSDEKLRESECHDAWFDRNSDIIHMLLSKGSSIICLQEAWLANKEFMHLYEKRLGWAGYEIYTLARTGGKRDGLLTAIKSDSINILNCRNLQLNDSGHRVAQFFHLRVRVPFYKRSQIAEQQLLLVNTHLLFPHDSSLCLIRLLEVYKILECLEQFKLEHGLTSVPVILCGDWNGSKRGHVYQFLRSQGFVSCYDSAHGYNDNDAHKWVSHRNHRGDICGVDFIWLRNPSTCYQSPTSRVKNAVRTMMTQEREDLMQNDLVLAKDLINPSVEHGAKPLVMKPEGKLTYFSEDLTTCKNITKSKSVPTFGLTESTNCINPLDLTIQDASLHPPLVEQGIWPKDYILSDHASLSATFRLSRFL